MRDRGRERSNPELPADVRAQANATCREFRRDVKQLGKGVLGETDLSKSLTEKLVKPSIPLLERIAKRQQALAAEAGNRQLHSSTQSLFDPSSSSPESGSASGRAERPAEIARARGR